MVYTGLQPLIAEGAVTESNSACGMSHAICLVYFFMRLCVISGEMISQGHMCLWCHQRSRVFGTVEDVQKHMVDKGHCMIKHDDTTRHEYADFYDYR